jgi:hypothetical protein
MSITSLFLITFLTFLPGSLSAHLFTVVLDPGIHSTALATQETLLCTQALQQTVAATFPHLRIVLSRTSEDLSDPLQNASFSNRIHADLYVSFNIFVEKDVAKSIQLYTHTPPSFLHTQKKSSSLSFIPAHSAYEYYVQQSHSLANTFVERAKNAGTIPVDSPRTLPLKALQAIYAPSFLIEIGVSKSKDWRTYFSQIFEGLQHVITVALKEKTERSHI